MTMGATTPPTIDERFENMLISPERVLEMLGRRRVGEVSFEQSEQGDARRLLLNVEKVAIENKRLQEKTEATMSLATLVSLRFSKLVSQKSIVVHSLLGTSLSVSLEL